MLLLVLCVIRRGREYQAVEDNLKHYAHSKTDTCPDDWHSLTNHLCCVANLAAQFAAEMHSEEWAFNAGRMHDLGKADPIFQAYLYRENDRAYPDHTIPADARVNHASTGAAKAMELYGEQTGKIFAYLIAGHHTGLPDYDSCDTGQKALSFRLHEGGRQLSSVEGYAKEIERTLKQCACPPPFVKPNNCHLWIRMLFSCLVDADFLDTEAFLKPNQATARKKFPPLDELTYAFERYMDIMLSESPKTRINELRANVLRACKQKAQNPPGLYSLTVPTGGGKTLSSIAFALYHAIKYKKKRIIYVIPYTSIIEQTAEILSEIFGQHNVIEHHSNLDPEKETRESKLAAENWDAPIVVTTNVQFFESLYAAKPGRCRKLHNIINSVVILDEAQLLPPELLTPCVDAINDLTRYFKVTMLLTTATQPALPSLDIATEIIDNANELYGNLRRTEVIFPENIQEASEWETIAARLQEHKQVLCVVNTRKDCRDLFSLMPEGTIHLSALMCGHHRSKVIAQIKHQLKNGEPVRAISTQLVEAGVDIDFPVVFRALAGLDSIVQAAGRCNREGKQNAEGRLGKVYVFVPPKPAPRGLLRKGEDATRALSALRDFDPHSPEAHTQYFQHFYSSVNDAGTIYQEWLVRDANPNMSFHFRTAAEKFKMIDDLAYQTVYVRYGESETLLEALERYGVNRETMRKLQRYTVNIPKGVAAGMLNDGLIYEIYPGILAQATASMYDPTTGFDIRRNNPNPEDLMI